MNTSWQRERFWWVKLCFWNLIKNLQRKWRIFKIHKCSELILKVKGKQNGTGICRASYYIKTLHRKTCISYVNWLVDHHWRWALIQSSSLMLVFTLALLCGLKSEHLTCCLLQRILPWFWVQSDELAALNQFSQFFFRLILFLYPLFTCFNLEYLIAKYVILRWNVCRRKF